MQAEVGKNWSAWKIDITPVISMDIDFEECCYHHLNSALGE
jgi:hypothetical protein